MTRHRQKHIEKCSVIPSRDVRVPAHKKGSAFNERINAVQHESKEKTDHTNSRPVLENEGRVHEEYNSSKQDSSRHAGRGFFYFLEHSRIPGTAGQPSRNTLRWQFRPRAKSSSPIPVGWRPTGASLFHANCTVRYHSKQYEIIIYVCTDTSSRILVAHPKI